MLAHRPADVEQPYGHGKVEFVAAGFDVSGMMLLAGLVMVLHAIEQLVNGVHVNESNLRIGLALMLVATIIMSGRFRIRPTREWAPWLGLNGNGQIRWPIMAPRSETTFMRAGVLRPLDERRRNQSVIHVSIGSS